MPEQTQNATVSNRLKEALRLPNGARFYRCALQINPFGYLQRHRPSAAAAFTSEAQYNAAIIDACREMNVEVIGVTDHYRVQQSAELLRVGKRKRHICFWGIRSGRLRKTAFIFSAYSILIRISSL